ncbi:MAG: hypothetical protein WCC64_03155 [Aliidongia sp.]
MAKEKRTNEMAEQTKHQTPNNEAAPAPVVTGALATVKSESSEAPIKVTSVPYTVPALNLEVGIEEKVQFKGSAFSVKNPNASVVQDLLVLLGDVPAQTSALCAALKSASYQVAKAAAMGDKYLDSNLRTKIVQIMKGTEQFGALDAKECYDRWVSGYKAKKPGAMKILEQAQAANSVEEYDM